MREEAERKGSYFVGRTGSVRYWGEKPPLKVLSRSNVLFQSRSILWSLMESTLISIIFISLLQSLRMGRPCFSARADRGQIVRADTLETQRLISSMTMVTTLCISIFAGVAIVSSRLQVISISSYALGLRSRILRPSAEIFEIFSARMGRGRDHRAKLWNRVGATIRPGSRRPRKEVDPARPSVAAYVQSFP